MSADDDFRQTTRRGDLPLPASDSGQSTRRADGPRPEAVQQTRRADGAELGSLQSTRRADGDAPPRPPEVPPAGTAPTLAPGQRIDQRYVVVSRFEGFTGEADVYRCRDSHEQSDVVVKFYLHGVEPQPSVIETLMNHRSEHLVTLLDHGKWDGRFYEVQEFCAGGTALDAFFRQPMTDADAERMVSQVVAGLHVLHEMELTHRDIKPSNIFYRDTERQTAVIGDYGIARAETGGVTVRAAGTHEYKAPEVVRGTYSQKCDYYALGITLLALLRRGAPFQDAQGQPFTPHAIVDLKAREEIPLPPGCSRRLADLILGLTRYGDDLRWGYKQVRQWLRRQPVEMDNGRPDNEYVPGGASRTTYVSDREIGSPVEMATKLGRHFSRQDAYYQKITAELFRGRITQWLESGHWSALSRAVEKIENDYTKDQELGTFLLRYTLDPRQPLNLTADHQVKNFEEFVALLEDCVQGDDTRTEKMLADLLDRSELTCWLRATVREPWVEELVEKIEDMRGRLASFAPSLRLFALFYLIRPQAPLRLYGKGKGVRSATSDLPRSNGTGSVDGVVQITSPAEIADVLDHAATCSDLSGGLRWVRASLDQSGNNDAIRLGIAQSLITLLYDGKLAEWLRSAFPGKPEEEQWARRCAMEEYRNEKMLGYLALRWHFEPDLGIEFNHEVISGPADLAMKVQIPDGYNRLWEMLRSKVLRTWLLETRRLTDFQAFDRILNDGAEDPWANVEAVLQMLHPSLGGPRLRLTVGQDSVESDKKDLGGIGENETHETRIQVLNRGRGYLAGIARVKGECAAIKGDGKIKGAPGEVVLVIRPRGLPLGRRNSAEVRVDSNGGRKVITFHFKVNAPYGEMVRNSLVAGGICAALLGVLRWLLGQVHPSAQSWMSWIDFAAVYPPSGEHASYMLFGVPFFLLIAGFVYYLVALSRRMRK